MLDITVLLDRSGSMNSRKEDHEGGLKSFIQDNKDNVEANFTFIQFDGNEPFQIILDNVNIKDVNLDDISLIPRGSTPLYDAIGKTIAHIEERKNDDLKIIFIVSDGENNSSTEWSGNQVHDAITKRPEWKFMFLGTNQDALKSGGDLGISAASSMGFENTSGGINNVYHSNTRSVSRMYAASCKGVSPTEALMAGNYTEEERAACADGNINLTTSTTENK